MPGTKEGAAKAHRTRVDRYGEDFYKKVGLKGSQAKVPKGFSMNPKLASELGKKGKPYTRKPRPKKQTLAL